MYENKNTSNYGGLGNMWGFGEAAPPKDVSTWVFEQIKAKKTGKPAAYDPKNYIPKKTVKVDTQEAASVLEYMWSKSRAPKKQMKGGVYWTATGPVVSEKQIKGASKAERVPMPETKFKPNIKIIRDLPKVTLPPVESAPAPVAPVPAKPPSTMQGFSAVDIPKKYLVTVLVLAVVIGIAAYLYKNKSMF